MGSAATEASVLAAKQVSDGTLAAASALGSVSGQAVTGLVGMGSAATEASVLAAKQVQDGTLAAASALASLFSWQQTQAPPAEIVSDLSDAGSIKKDPLEAAAEKAAANKAATDKAAAEKVAADKAAAEKVVAEKAAADEAAADKAAAEKAAAEAAAAEAAAAEASAPSGSVVTFTLKLAGELFLFTPDVQVEIRGAIAAEAGVQPSSVEAAVSSGEFSGVIVDVSIHTPTATADSVQSKMFRAMSSMSKATTVLSSVTSIDIVVLRVTKRAQTRPHSDPSQASYVSSRPR